MPTQPNQIYKCEICGNIVTILHEAVGTLICCGQPMILQQANTIEASHERHIPVIEETENGTRVKIGSEPHPMEPEHYIEWIEIRMGGNYARHFLKPSNKPETEFSLKPYEKPVVRAYCNLHGLWEAQ